MRAGDYVRTKNGDICKIININDFREPSMKYGVDVSYLKDIVFIGDKDIIKSSSNLVDLIEVGDYVNGFKVDKVEQKFIWFGDASVTLAYKCNYDKYYIRPEDIEAIVTKEQFKSIQYEVG